MNEESFLQRRQPDWVRLMVLCDKADRSPTDLLAPELKELFRLYRRVSTDLAVARTVSTSPSLIAYLNDLAARAYAVVYREPRQSVIQVLLNAIATSAQTVRRRKHFILASFVLFFGSGLIAFFLTHNSPELRAFFVRPEMEMLFQKWKEGHFDERTGSESALMSGFYASNNPRVSVIAGSVGAGTFGLLSLFMLAQNGAMIGILGNEMSSVGKLGYFFASIAPHGVPELSGIIVSGATGLLLGYALINPGRMSRGASLRAVGKDAIVLLGTSVVLMFIAAPIEGFFSFNPRISTTVKTIVAIISLVLWLLFWTGFGKTAPEQKQQVEP